MTVRKRVHNKTLKNVKNSSGTNNFSRDAWVEQVLKITSLKYNIDPEDFERFVERQKGKR